MTFTTSTYGYEFRTPYALGFFSFGNLTWQQLAEINSHLSFDRVKQVHGDRMVESNGIYEEADAIFTDRPKRAVTVLSADCLPILILNPEKVVAIHAGWRGVKNEIILKSLQHFGIAFCENSDTQALIGPHIQEKSFEVDRNLGEEFQEQYQVYRIAGSDPNAPNSITTPHPHKPTEKAFVDLQTIAIQQLLLAGLKASQIHTLNIDTLTDSRFASYRRDKGNNVGRNFSFASRL